MITNFEDITKELTDYELNTVVPAMISGLITKIGKENAITNDQMRKGLKDVLNIKTTSPRIRKMIHYIRISGRVERLIATSKGYYISNNKEELESYISSLMERINSINSIAEQLIHQKNKI